MPAMLLWYIHIWGDQTAMLGCHKAVVGIATENFAGRYSRAKSMCDQHGLRSRTF